MENPPTYPCEFVYNIENHAAMFKCASNIMALLDIMEMDNSIGEKQLETLNSVLDRFDGYVATIHNYPGFGVA